MSQLQLALDGDQIAFEPGAELRVTATWDLERPASQIELRLFWYTQGKGDTDVYVVQKLPFLHPEPRDSKRLAIRLPDGPYSFSGKLISLIWGLELVAQGSKEAARLEFLMAPGGEEIVLEEVDTKKSAFQLNSFQFNS